MDEGSVGLMTDTAFSVPASLRRADHVPRPIAIAYQALVVALLAGIAETIARVAIALDDYDVEPAGLAIGLTTRCVLYAAVLFVAIRMTHGDRWARLLLTFGIGVVGLASLLIEPLTAALDADDLGAILTGAILDDLLVATLRIVHILAVPIAVVAMYRPAARAYFRR